MARIRILDDGVSVEADGERVRLSDSDAWLVTALALGSAQCLPAAIVQRALGGEMAADSLRKYLARLQEITGLSIDSQSTGSGRIYCLNGSAVSVDALRYLEIADEIRRDPGGDHRGAVYEARSLWHTGPPELHGWPNPAPEMYERLSTAYAYVQSLRKRILIVDDQVGDLLAERLNRHECVVAHDLKEFNALKSELHRFDLAVVDLHLSTTYADATGDVIVRDINAQALALPVIMITLRPPTNRSLPEWIKSLGLVDVVFKEGDEPGANMAFVAERVNALLLEDPVERTCEQITERVHTLRRKAGKRLAVKLTGPAHLEAVESMEADADRVVRLAEHLKLAEARRAIERFVASWGE